MDFINRLAIRLYVRLNDDEGLEALEYIAVAAGLLILAYGAFKLIGIDIMKQAGCMVSNATGTSCTP